MINSGLLARSRLPCCASGVLCLPAHGQHTSEVGIGLGATNYRVKISFGTNCRITDRPSRPSSKTSYPSPARWGRSELLQNDDRDVKGGWCDAALRKDTGRPMRGFARGFSTVVSTTLWIITTAPINSLHPYLFVGVWLGFTPIPLP
jgi:hypothetical protein